MSFEFHPLECIQKNFRTDKLPILSARDELQIKGLTELSLQTTLLIGQTNDDNDCIEAQPPSNIKAAPIPQKR